MRPFFSRLVVVASFLVAVLALPGRASAQAVHFSRGGAQFAANQSDFTGTGFATHLGHYTETGHVSFAATRFINILAVTGCATYTAANGDELRARITGELNTDTGAIIATLEYVGGTGRFTDVSGSAVLTGQMLGGGAVQVTVVGNIDPS